MVIAPIRTVPASGGVLAVDGRIIIRARYMEVEIDRDGTARLTLVPGKMETVKLTD